MAIPHSELLPFSTLLFPSVLLSLFPLCCAAVAALHEPFSGAELSLREVASLLLIVVISLCLSLVCLPVCMSACLLPFCCNRVLGQLYDAVTLQQQTQAAASFPTAKLEIRPDPDLVVEGTPKKQPNKHIGSIASL